MPAKPKLDEESPVVAHSPVVLRRSSDSITLDFAGFALPLGSELEVWGFLGRALGSLRTAGPEVLNVSRAFWGTTMGFLAFWKTLQRSSTYFLNERFGRVNLILQAPGGFRSVPALVLHQHVGESIPAVLEIKLQLHCSFFQAFPAPVSEIRE